MRTEVRAEWNMVYILNCTLPFPPHGSGVERTGLIREGLTWPELVPGVWGGPIGVTVDSLPHRPEEVDLSWEDIAEFSAIVENGPLVPCGMSELPAVGWPKLDAFGPGTYRVRVHARGRDTALDAVVAEVTEEYLLISWLEDASPATAIVLSSRRAKALLRSEETHPRREKLDRLGAEVRHEQWPVPAPGGPRTPSTVIIRLDPDQG